MLPLSNIAGLQETVDAAWSSPVADAVAAAWGHPPGAARYWRSSASHVFVVLTPDGTRRQGFLRLVPATYVPRGDLETVTSLMACLATRGLGTVRPLASREGSLVETVPTRIGEVHAMLVGVAPGEEIEVEELSPRRTLAWGGALGRWHRDGDAAAAGLPLPDGYTRIRAALAALDADPALTGATSLVADRLEDLPRDPGVYGLVHGDFELDNLAWSGDTPTVFDLDEAERSWFLADVAYAVRDLVPEPVALLDRSCPPLERFLSGYLGERSATELDRQHLLLFSAVNALRCVARQLPVLAEDPSVSRGIVARMPGLPRPLRAVLEEYVLGQRALALELAGLLG